MSTLLKLQIIVNLKAIYADFEAFVVSIDTVSPDPSMSYTTNTVKLITTGFCYVIVNSYAKSIEPPVVYSSSNVIDTFLT